MSSGLYNGVSGLALGTGLYKSTSGLWSGASGLLAGTGGASTQTVFNILLAGQSEMYYITNPQSNYNIIPQPVNVPDGNVVMYTQDVALGPLVTTVVNQTTANARQVNPAMAALACALGYVHPGKTFHIGAAVFSGTGRSDLADDTTDPDGRYWSDFAGMITATTAGAGRAPDILLECWYRSDSAFTANFVNAFWPIYFGSTGAGANFTIPSVNAVTSRTVSRCIWDAQAASNTTGRGVLTRDATKWSILTPMSDIFAYPVAPTAEATNFTAVSSAMGEPRRQVVMDLASNSIAQSVGVLPGPSAVIMRFDVPGGTDGGPTHPTTNPVAVGAAAQDGQVAFMWPFFVAIANEAGSNIQEPYIESLEAATDGSWCDVLVRLPNNGTLTTRRVLESRSAVSSSVPHRQDVIGFEIGRAGVYRPVFNTAEVSYPANTRGTVTITDTGSGTPKRGKVRITPTTAFAFGDSLRYLAGGASAVLQTPRDMGVELDMLLETIPALRDTSATYPFPGVAVRPYQSDFLVPVPPPAFTPTAANFGTTAGGNTGYFLSTSISQAAGSTGMFSIWVRLDDTAWNATARCVFELRYGSTIAVNLLTSSAGRFNLRLNNSTATDTFPFFATSGGGAFVPGQWYHIMVSWKTDGTLGNSDLTIYVNNQQVRTGTFAATVDMSGQTLTRLAIGGNASPAQLWQGDIGLFWMEVNLPTWFDLSDSTNRAKFASAGVPVNLGGNGQTPTGTAPKWYYNGAGSAITNTGTAGNIPLVGTLNTPTVAPTTPQY
jgi:hypothetical protein